MNMTTRQQHDALDMVTDYWNKDLETQKTFNTANFS